MVDNSLMNHFSSNPKSLLFTFQQGKLCDTTVSDEATWTLGRFHTSISTLDLNVQNHAHL